MTAVLLHPLGLDAECWTFSGLEGQTPEYPGHGGRPLPASGRYTLEEVADEVAATCDGMLDLVGLSFGAVVAEHVALRHPSRVRSVLIGAGGASQRTSAEAREEATSGRPLVEGQRSRQLVRAEEQARSSMADTLATNLPRWFTAEALSTPDHPGVAYVKRRWLANDPREIAATWVALSGSAIRDLLPRIDCPVTILAGRRDMAAGPAATPVEAAHELQSFFPTSRLDLIDGPHFFHIECPVEFAAAVKRHLAWAASLAA